MQYPVVTSRPPGDRNSAAEFCRDTSSYARLTVYDSAGFPLPPPSQYRKQMRPELVILTPGSVDTLIPKPGAMLRGQFCATVPFPPIGLVTMP